MRNLRDRLPRFEYREAGYYAAFRSKPIRGAFAYLNPAKRNIRLFLPLDPGADPHLRPTPSTHSWAERFPNVFQVAGEDDLPAAARLITKSYADAIVDKAPRERGLRGALIDVERQDLNDEVIDLAIRENRLRLGMVPTDSEIALARQRRGQEQLRRLTLMNYDSTCALCDVNDSSLLIASHIVGWAEVPEARGMLSNLICLCRFHDALFEQGYWSLADDFTVLRKPRQRSRTIAFLLDSSMQFRRPHNHPPAPCFLRQHRLRCGLGGQ